MVNRRAKLAGRLGRLADQPVTRRFPDALTLRLARAGGWLALLLSSGIVLGVIAAQTASGPELGQSLRLSPRMWRYLFATLAVAAGATGLALILAMPAAYAIITARRPWQRRSLIGLTLIPLLTMPSIFGYAWLLLGTSSIPAVRRALDALGWNIPGAAFAHAAAAQATWLWPIPALILATSFRHVGAGAYRLASLDAGPARALLRGAVPALRAPLLAACAAVFILAATDTTIPPLVNCFDLWQCETMANAGIARKFARPAAFMFWQSWPMLATIGLVAVLAWPGVRRMARWAADPETPDTGTAPPAATWTWAAAILIALIVTFLPILVFVTEMRAGRYTTGEAFRTALHSLNTTGRATAIVALAAGLTGGAIALLAVDEPRWPRPIRWVGRIALGLTLLTAVLPPPLIGTTLVSWFSNPHISPPDHWNLYDNTPLAWVGAMAARFAFVPVCMMYLLNRRVPREISDQAATDGANRMRRLAATRLPMLWRGGLASMAVVVCLSFSEVAASSLVQPPQWIGGSLAVLVDSQMHYARHDQTIALSLLMMGPALIAAVLLPLLTGRRGRHEHLARAATSGTPVPPG